VGDDAGPDVRLRVIRRYGPPPAALAIAGDLIATGDAAGRVELFVPDVPEPLARWPGIGAGQQVSLAPSGAAVLLRSAAGDLLELRRANDGHLVARLAARYPGVPLATGTIVGTPYGEVLVASTERMRLRIVDVPTGAVRLDVRVERPRGFEYQSVVPTGDPDTVIAIGRYASEMKDSLIALSLRGLLTDAEYLPRTVARPAVTDYAYRLAAGPGAGGEAVFYRDPEDDEDDENDPNRLDVHGIHGYYVRRLADRALVAGPVDGPAPAGDLLAATAHHILAPVSAGVQVIPRSGGTPTVVPATVIGMDPRAPRCVLDSPGTGDLRLLTVPSGTSLPERGDRD